MAKAKNKKNHSVVAWGRPRAFDDVQEFGALCKGYFVNLKKKAPNIAGICVYLGISRDTWYEYRKDKKFSDTIKDVELAVESWWVDRLRYPGAGPIFYLKNFRPEHYKERGVGDSPENPVHIKQITGMRIVRGQK